MIILILDVFLLILFFFLVESKYCDLNKALKLLENFSVVWNTVILVHYARLYLSS